MPRTCATCAHPQRTAIDRALAEGKPLPTITALFRVSPDALARHKAHHLPTKLAKATRAAEAANADSLLDRVRSLQARDLTILDRAEADGQLMPAPAAIRETRGCLELMGELDERPQGNVLVAPEWLSLRATILAALAPYPEARAAVAERLAGPTSAGATPGTGGTR